MVDIKIDKNIALPPEKKNNNYPYKQMKVGDSFFIQDGKISVICNSNYRMSKQLSQKFTARKEGEGVRVWRTE
jgi:hypothetical protein